MAGPTQALCAVFHLLQSYHVCKHWSHGNHLSFTSVTVTQIVEQPFASLPEHYVVGIPQSPHSCPVSPCKHSCKAAFSCAFQTSRWPGHGGHCQQHSTDSCACASAVAPQHAPADVNAYGLHQPQAVQNCTYSEEARAAYVWQYAEQHARAQQQSMECCCCQRGWHSAPASPLGPMQHHSSRCSAGRNDRLAADAIMFALRRTASADAALKATVWSHERGCTAWEAWGTAPGSQRDPQQHSWHGGHQRQSEAYE